MDSPPDPPSSATPSRDDRRRSPRSDVLGIIVGLGDCRLDLKNISEGGCLGYCSCVLDPGQNVTLRVLEGNDAIYLRARVAHGVRVSGTPDVVYVAGLEFLHLQSPVQQVAVKRLIEICTREE